VGHGPTPLSNPKILRPALLLRRSQLRSQLRYSSLDLAGHDIERSDEGGFGDPRLVSLAGTAGETSGAFTGSANASATFCADGQEPFALLWFGPQAREAGLLPGTVRRMDGAIERWEGRRASRCSIKSVQCLQRDVKGARVEKSWICSICPLTGAMGRWSVIQILAEGSRGAVAGDIS
jgi:hypothetical protein